MKDTTLYEALNDDTCFGTSSGRLIESGKTNFQRYEVWDTPQFGRLFRLDGSFMTSERDEFFYHENLVHVAGSAHARLRTALILGGGDGGSAEELLKYPEIARVVVVELEEKVVEIARAHLASVHRGAFDDPRLELHIGDGLRYVEEQVASGGERFDLIVFDLTEPEGPAAALYTERFLATCKSMLTDGGALTLHLGSPVYRPERVRALVTRLRAVFTTVSPYFLYIPLYGSLWGMAVASDMLDPTAIAACEVDARLAARGIGALQYYNGEVHCAQFAQPNYLRALLR